MTGSGEGAYEETESATREMAGAAGERVQVDAEGIAAGADWEALGSPETYAGSARSERRTSGPLGLNAWSLSGQWSVGEEAAAYVFTFGWRRGTDRGPHGRDPRA